METSAVTNLLQSDALTNLFEVSFNVESIPSFRIRGFQPPKSGLKIEHIPYKGVTVPKIIPQQNLERVLEFEIRIDSSYSVYRSLRRIRSNWLSLGASTDINPQSSSDLTITVKANSDSVSWQFFNAKLIELSLPPFEHENSKPIYAKATFIYGDYKES